MKRNKVISHKRNTSNGLNVVDVVGESKTTNYASIIHCQACSSNQINHQNGNEITVTSSSSKKTNPRRHPMDFKVRKGFPLWTVLILTWMNFFVVLTEGLRCYECLSLHCDSGAVCDAIKRTMLEIFIPKRHFIHFDPSDMCPQNEPPMNSERWANLSKECERSDSICLVSPIEVHTVVDGKKDGKQLEKEYTLITNGYLLGCASRRKLLEFPETINVRVEFTGRNESGNSGSGKSTSTGSNTPNSSGSSSNQKKGEGSSGNLEQRGTGGRKKQTEIFYNLTNAGNGAVEFDPTKKTYKDGYIITKIYSHVFYIDQGTGNATRCYENNCNDKVKFRKTGTGTSGTEMISSSNISAVLWVVIAVIMQTISS